MAENQKDRILVSGGVRRPGEGPRPEASCVSLFLRLQVGPVVETCVDVGPRPPAAVGCWSFRKWLRYAGAACTSFFRLN